MTEQQVIELMREINQESYEKLDEYVEKNLTEAFDLEDYYSLEFSTNGYASIIKFMGRVVWNSEDWGYDDNDVQKETAQLRETLKKAMYDHIKVLRAL